MQGFVENVDEFKEVVFMEHDPTQGPERRHYIQMEAILSISEEVESGAN